MRNLKLSCSVLPSDLLHVDATSDGGAGIVVSREEGDGAGQSWGVVLDRASALKLAAFLIDNLSKREGY